MRRSVALLLLTLGSGCTTTATVPVIQPDVPVAIPPAQPMSLNSVHWQVMGVRELRSLVTQLEKAQQHHIVLFVLDEQNYTNLMLNYVEIERFLREQQTILDMLKKIIADRSDRWDVPDNK